MSVEKKEEVTTTVRYVVTLNEEEARALGALRYSHMDRRSALGKALSGLPELAADFPGIPRGSCIGEPKFRPNHVDRIAGRAFSSAVIDICKVMADNVRTGGVPGLSRSHNERIAVDFEAFPSWVLRPPAKSEPKKYKVQFKPHGSDSWCGHALREEFMPVGTRNEAYRVMRKRGAYFKGWDPSTNSNEVGSYRVVSADVKDGPEEDRGHYRVQFWARDKKLWKDCSSGPGFSGVKYFSTAAAAQAAINARGFYGSTYRVKWYPGEK